MEIESNIHITSNDDDDGDNNDDDNNDDDNKYSYVVLAIAKWTMYAVWGTSVYKLNTVFSRIYSSDADNPHPHII